MDKDGKNQIKKFVVVYFHTETVFTLKIIFVFYNFVFYNFKISVNLKEFFPRGGV